jgi:hypothetical protein
MQNIRILKNMHLMQNIQYSNLENYAFDAKYSNLENYAPGLPVNKIASTLCIYTIITDNFAVCVGKQRVPVCHLSSQ